MSRGIKGESEQILLHPDDLIDDRELSTAKDDQLAHDGIVRQLAALVTSVPTPSNVALYGPWGSGKSGIANLLQSKIDHKQGVRFVRFDAFKYADVPLRRNFISAVAGGLGHKNRKYHADLYSGKTKTDISVPPTTIIRLIIIFATLLGALMIILAAVVSLVAWAQAEEFWLAFRGLLKQTILAGLLPASLLSALIAMSSKSFSVDHSLAKPESDEQFEQLFRDLVSDSRAERLVVFVDELDRCSADEVVTTLDTVRTFLGINKCVFIIAADQYVLEEALTRATKQETPTNEANPYYSTGSAYLDKVFQYQVGLPPLLTQSVSKYAATLVEGRRGLWGDINTEYVLSVLVPAHVSSPRRVKHLLNTFALTYRMAEERHRSGLLTDNPCDNAAAIARLVCLRVEFPLFARHLEIEANLPDLVLQLDRNPETQYPSDISERAQQLARAYALDGAPPATVLATEEDTDSVSDDAKQGADTSRTTPTSKAHNRQLLNYLSRTRQVRGPSRNLVYMQSSGSVFGLEGDLAVELERAAEDGDIDTLQRRIGGLDEGKRDGALELLSQQIRTGLGVVAPNTARSLLLLMEAIPNLRVEHIIDSVIEAICVWDDDSGVLDEDTVASAWALARTGTEAGALTLRRRVITKTIALGSETSTGFLLEEALLAVTAAPTEMVPYIASLLVSEEAPATLSYLFNASDEDLVQLLNELRTTTATQAKAAAEAHSVWKNTQKTAATTPSKAPTGPSTAASVPEEEPFTPKALFEAIVREAGPRETPVQHAALKLLLAIDVPEARHAAAELIPQSEPVTQPEFATVILRATDRRNFTEWPKWLKGISAEAIQSAHASQLDGLVFKLWSREEPESTTRAALQEIVPLVMALPEDLRPNLTARVINAIEPLVSDADEASARSESLAHTDLFVAAGFIESSAIAESVVSTLQDTLAQSLDPVDLDNPLYTYLSQNGAAALSRCSDLVGDEYLNGILTESVSCPWLNELARVELAFTLATATGRPAEAMERLPSAQMVADVVYNYGSSASHASKLWLALTQPDPDDFALVFDKLLFENAVSPEFADAAQEAQADWSPAESQALLNRYLVDPDSAVPAARTLQVIGLARVTDGDAASLLCDRFLQSTNNTQRQAVVELWQKADINDPAARKRLIETIVYGLIDLHIDGNRNAGAVELALHALTNLGRPLPYGVKGALGQRLKNAVDGNEVLETKAMQVLPRLGYSTTFKGLFSKKRRVDFSGD